MATALPHLRIVAQETKRTHCPYCAFQCGMTVTTDADERELDVQADPDFPVNRGQMCIKGFTSASLLDHPARLTSPMLRTSDGRLVPVTWDRALDYVAEKLETLRDRYGAASLGTF